MSIIRLRNLAAASCLLFVLSIASSVAVTQDASSDQKTPAAAAQSNSAKSPAAKPSAADITAAKASGKVWVNLDSGIYHKAGRWYGKTKDGKFMTEAEARKAGYKAAKRN